MSWLSYLASVLAFAGDWRYIRSVIRGDTRTDFSGWLIFSISMSCVLASAYALGARDSLPLIAAFSAVNFIIALLSLRFGAHFSLTDTLLLLLSIAALLLWWLTANPWYTLLLNILIDIFGFIAIAVHLYQHPASEDSLAWGMSTLAYALNLAAIARWTPQEYLFSLSNVFWCGVIFILSLRTAPTIRKEA